MTADERAESACFAIFGVEKLAKGTRNCGISLKNAKEELTTEITEDTEGVTEEFRFDQGPLG